MGDLVVIMVLQFESCSPRDITLKEGSHLLPDEVKGAFRILCRIQFFALGVMKAQHRVLPRVVPQLQRHLQRRFVSKLRDSADAALDGMDLDGATVAVGGFGPCGVPETLIDALCRKDSAKNLTLVALDVGTDNRGVGKLIKAGKFNCVFRLLSSRLLQIM